MKNKKRKIQSIIILILLFILCIVATAGITVLYVNKTSEDKIKESTTTTIEIITTKAMPRATQLNKTTIPANKQSLQLEKIEVEGRDIEFSPTKYYYDIDIPYNVTKLNIKTKAMNENTRTFTSGNEELQVGLNTITIQTYNEDREFAFYKLFIYRTNQSGEININEENNITITTENTSKTNKNTQSVKITTNSTSSIFTTKKTSQKRTTTSTTTTTTKSTTKTNTTNKTTKNIKQILHNALIKDGYINDPNNTYYYEKITNNDPNNTWYYSYNNSTKILDYSHEVNGEKTLWFNYIIETDEATLWSQVSNKTEVYAKLNKDNIFTCSRPDICKIGNYEDMLTNFKKNGNKFVTMTGLTRKEIISSEY